MNSKNKLSIYIVEDNEVFKLALKADIEATFKDRCDLKIKSFSTGEACMEKFKLENPQVVILDYHLDTKNPDAADGIKVLDWIKEVNPDTNVIMLTGDDNMDIALKSFHHHASDYVVKTETKFQKINYSLLNLIKNIEAKAETTIYKNMLVGVAVCAALLIGAGIAVLIIKPTLFL
jgi:two-component system OmpR family response regulator